jgi:hypothetical protein
VIVGDFTIDIATVDKQDLISLRKYVPRDEYKLIKNRKIARLCRMKRKNERGAMRSNLEVL